MGVISQWLTMLPVWSKAVGALGAAFGAGLTLAFVLSGWASLPSRVQEHDIKILSLQVEQAAAKDERLETLHKLDRVLCLLTLPDSTRPLDAQRACP